MVRLPPRLVNDLLGRLRYALSPAARKDLLALSNLLQTDTHTVTLDVVHEHLFAGRSVEAANKARTRLADHLAQAAAKNGVRLAIHVSADRRAGAAGRELWFEGEPATVEQMMPRDMARLGDALVKDTVATPIGEPRVRLTERDAGGRWVVRYFVSYAHDDERDVARLTAQLQTALQSSPDYAFEPWSDQQLVVGQQWKEGILEALDGSHLGLLCVTRAFLASQFIDEHELPHFVRGRGHDGRGEGKRAIPVALHAVPFNSTVNWKGLEQHQVFRDEERKAFAERRGARQRAWTEALIHQMHKVLDRFADKVEPSETDQEGDDKEGRPAFDLDCARPPRADDMLSADLGRIGRHLLEDAQGQAFSMRAAVAYARRRQTAEPLDRLADDEETGAPRTQALDYLMGWLKSEDESRLFALLGEYGTGKTITSQRLVQEVDRLRESDPDLPIPFYLDLRTLTDLDRGVPTLEQVLEQASRAWRTPVRPTAVELLDWARASPCLFVFDGLDEVLVHLDAHGGIQLTAGLLRLLDQSHPNTRMLLSCRTHYFRTMREQTAHFTGHYRGGTRTSDYAALIMLPFTDEQVRAYLQQAVPGLDVARAMDLVRSVHNLSELAERPVTLSFIAEEIPTLEALRAEGRTVRGVTLYRLLVERWLARDGGKHQLRPDHKQWLMEEMAALAWRRGQRVVPLSELEDALHAWLAANPSVDRRYRNHSVDKLEEDLRTATFLVRDDESEGFRFAHTSMLEYFLARYLASAIRRDNADDWSMPAPSRETWTFFGQVLEEEPELVASLGSWAPALAGRGAECVLRYVAHAVPNALPVPSLRGLNASGVDACDLVLQGTVEAPLDLRESRWAGSALRRTRWERVRLDGAAFEASDMRHAEWNQVHAAHVRIDGSNTAGWLLRDVTWPGHRWSGPDGSAVRAIRTDLESGSAAARTSSIRRLVAAIGHRGEIQGCAWSPDGKRLASVGLDDTVRIWDATTGDLLHIANCDQGGINSCGWSPDGLRLVSGGADGTICVWDATTGLPLHTAIGHQGSVIGCAWSPDGTRLVSGGLDRTVRVWDAVTGDLLRTITDRARSCAWSPDGTRLAAGGSYGTVRVWEVATGDLLHTSKDHQGPVLSCAWSPDGLRLASGGDDGSVRIWDASTGRYVHTFTQHERVLSCAWSPDGTQLVSGGDDGAVRVWDATTGDLLILCDQYQRRVLSCAWSPDGTRIVSGGSTGTIQVRDAVTGDLLHTATGHQLPVLTCAWSPDGTRIVSGEGGGTIRVWDAATGDLLCTASGHRWRANSCAWSPEGLRLVSCGIDEFIRVWDAVTGDLLHTAKFDEVSAWSCAWSPDGTRFAAGGNAGSVQVWDAATGDLLHTAKGHQGLVTSSGWSPDGMRLVSGGLDGTVRVWDATTGDLLRTATGHQRPVLSCAWSPGGTRLVSAGADGTVRVWDAATGALLHTAAGHRGDVTGCGWSPDGTRVVSCGNDGTLRVWEAATGDLLHTATGHQLRVWSCAWSPDGTRLVSAGADGTVRVWDAHSYSTRQVIQLFDDGSHAAWIPGDPETILHASPGAWRHLHWVRYDADRRIIDSAPAEHYGPLPTSSGSRA